MEFGKACEELSFYDCTSTPDGSEINGLAERAVRRIREELLLCCNNPAWMGNGGMIPRNAPFVGDLSSPHEHKGVSDEWFVDNGQIFVRPLSFDGWLRASDAALTSIGAT